MKDYIKPAIVVALACVGMWLILIFIRFCFSPTDSEVRRIEEFLADNDYQVVVSECWVVKEDRTPSFVYANGLKDGCGVKVFQRTTTPFSTNAQVNETWRVCRRQNFFGAMFLVLDSKVSSAAATKEKSKDPTFRVSFSW